MSAASHMALMSSYGLFGNDSFTKLLLHGDGADASTTITDSSSAARAMTAAGNAQLDTAQFKFGTASILLDGTGDEVTTPDSADFDFAAGEFTIDVWIRFNALPTGTLNSGSGAIIVSQFANLSRAWMFGVGTTGAPNYQLTLKYNSATATGSNVSLSTGTWYHMAVVRDNSGTDTIRFFLDGVAAGTDTTIDAVTIADSTAIVSVGGAADTFSANTNGWIDELRVSKGVARWTAAFNPPARPYG